eukprot:NODE_10582_length_1342_cov_2.258436.p1 GENE.NODE_10582_length_1342_cov_2.258436~~NODE_10582_length_1342_cov_2.258436.p1  ORF type:complete len:180 (+),score=57.15 NODE_10582_length_1342_cov_2.258436:274-813(+)
MDVMAALGCCVHWDGVLLAEWTSLLLFLSGSLLAEPGDSGILSAVVAHVADVLAFEDELMATHLPSELAAATVHAAVLLCTRQFQRYALTLRIGHLCRLEEERVVHLAERVLKACIGARCSELILEGSAFSAEDSSLDEQEASPRGGASPAPRDEWRRDSIIGARPLASGIPPARLRAV